MKSQHSLTVTLLTLTGTLPFLAGALGVLAPQMLSSLLGLGTHGALFTLAASRISLIVYGIAILSFMTGIRWGSELTADTDTIRPWVMGLAVVPALLAWGAGVIALVLPGYTGQAAMVLALAFFSLLFWDLNAGYQPWYVRLRIIATIAACGSLSAVTFGGTF